MRGRASTVMPSKCWRYENGDMTRTLAELRCDYHRKIEDQIFSLVMGNGGPYPNFADGGSQSSVLIANGIAERLKFNPQPQAPKVTGQTAGSLFERITCEFVEASFESIRHLRPGEWAYMTAQTKIHNFAQYRHLDELQSMVRGNSALSSALGHGYLVTPDIVVARHPVTTDQVNAPGKFLDDSEGTLLTPFLSKDQTEVVPFLHASISCKWTIRSDRSQNTRTEALNLMRNRKGRLPHIVAVTAEPLPMRIASLALGTGDLDCVYHLALDELRETCATTPQLVDQAEILETMVQGQRLRDIRDLAFDLAV